ncbi:24962_t:CDS:2, partial [Cetraspora pellucida]
IKNKLDEYWPIMQETTKIATFFDPYFKRIVYYEQSVDEILTLIHINLLANSTTITQPSLTSKHYQFIQKYTNTYMPIIANQLIFSNLASMTKDYLSIMATSVLCKQLFSLA